MSTDLADAESVITDAEIALDARRPWSDVLTSLAKIEAGTLPPRLKGRCYVARGVAENRRGSATAAAECFLEAQKVFAALNDHEGLSNAWRELGVVHSWRGAGRAAGFAFVRAIAEAALTPSRKLVARAVVESARAHIEIGQPENAVSLLELVLGSAVDDLSSFERNRAEVMLIKSLNDAHQGGAAKKRLASLERDGLAPRERLLVLIEQARIHMRDKNFAEADTCLEEIRQRLPADTNSFEHVEYLEILCETQLAAGKGNEALGTIEKIVPRFQADDLGAPLVNALSRRALAYDLLKQKEAAADAAAGALRRAAERQLQREVDSLRESLVLRGQNSQALLDLSKGRVDGRFIRCDFIGSGGFGKVMRAYDCESGEEVALKQIEIARTYDGSLRKMLFESAQREVEAARLVDHPGIAPVLGIYYEPDGDIFIASKFVRGKTLRQAMMAGRPRLWPEIVAALSQALEALHKANVVHGDLKPENVILRDDGSPVLVDFGSAIFSSCYRDYAAASFTADYAAPEQMRRRQSAVEPSADLFALGGIAYELVRGRRLQRAIEHRFIDWSRRLRIEQDLRASGANVAQARMIARCLSVDATRRPKSAAAVGEAFV